MPKVIKKKSTGGIISVDFTGVTSSGAVPEDNYSVKVDEVTQEEGPKAPYLNFKLKITDGDYKGKVIWHICTLAKDGLFNLRGVLEALGIEVPESLMKLKLSDLKGLEMGVSTEIEIYKKKPRTRVVDVFSLEEGPAGEEETEESEEGTEEGEESTEEETEETEEETEEEETVDLESMNLKELVAFAKKNKIKLTDQQKISANKTRRAIEAALE